MENRGRALRVSFIRISPAMLLPVLVCCIGCAGKAKQAQPSFRERDDPAPPLAEEFDPRSVREDLLLIEPRFPPPSRRTAAPSAESPVQEGGRVESPVEKQPSSGSPPEEGQGGYRVQVVSLSIETGALKLAESLQRQFGVEVTVSPHNGLHAVRAGRFADPEAAQSLRERIAELDSDFADAFVVGDPAREPVKSRTEKSPLPGEGGEQDLPGQENAGGVRSPGWRVLIHQFLALADAEEFRRKAVERLDRNDVEINFHEPWYKVEVGQFPAGEEAAAQKLVALVKRRGFPRALKVRGEVTVPEKDQ